MSAAVHTPPAPGTPTRLDLGVVEAEQVHRRDLALHGGQVDLHAEGGFELLRGGDLADRHQLVAAGGTGGGGVGRVAEAEGGHAERRDDAVVDERAVVAPAGALDQLGQHPVGRGGVVLVAGAGLPDRAPPGEAGAAPLAGEALERRQRRLREPAGVGDHLLDGDGLHAVGGELGHEVTDPVVPAQLALADQEPHRRRRRCPWSWRRWCSGCRVRRRRRSRTGPARRPWPAPAGTRAAAPRRSRGGPVERSARRAWPGRSRARPDRPARAAGVVGAGSDIVVPPSFGVAPHDARQRSALRSDR